VEADRFFIANEDEVQALRIARKGSTGQIAARRLIDPEESGSRQAVVLLLDVPPRQPQAIPPHYHSEYEETMYILSGRGEYRVGPSPEDMRAFPIQPGSCVYMPADYYHQILVEGDEPMRILASYWCSEGKGGKSHRQIALELTSLPFDGEYGQPLK
jgi:mannose-6-phosphate isomerase-like protein (cupin superfamily)